ncbi:TonB-dependent receptor [Sphingomonas cavernae]|uniref:TonB-dependent receptor n=1 Tax=Sphingomonas cavernae TaxID=2320861 RepID=A0A418WPF4_9SPHN|nr:TonB-dependent receptor [Sphingomonas cavernae]RJF93127.1 TonB-dependent receptor [Sphingomonas cavernae]
MRNRVQYSTASLFALIAALGAPPAFAQDAAPAAEETAAPQEDTGGISDIVVTAQKRAENVQDVPIAISAVDEAYLKSRDISSIDRLGSVAPNVKIERAPSNKTISQISIRGSVTINPAITWEPAVGLYLDGVYIAKAQGSIFDVADLERVEVLRGPQGTLYGRNTLAGAVNLITKKPSGELGGSVEATYGNFDYWKLKGVVDLPKFGIFSVKLSGQIQKRDGFIDIGPNPYPQAFLARPNSVDETNDIDGKSGMIQVRAEPSDTLTFDYMFDYTRYNQRPDFAQLYHVNRNGDPRDIFDPNSPSYPFVGQFFPLNLYDRTERQSSGSIDADPLYEKSKTWGHALTATLELGDATLKSITAYRKLRWSDSIDLDGSPLPVAMTARDSRYHAFSQELQLSGTTLDDRLKYVVGAYYFKDKAETDNPQNFFGGAQTFVSNYGSHTEAYAAYGQVDFSVTDSLTLVGGLRYNHEKKDVMRLLQFTAAGQPQITLIDVPYGGVPDATYNDLSPSFTVRYEPGGNVDLYARYAKGFKSGGFNGETNVVVLPTPDCPSGAPELCEPYRPEKVDSYEVGVKTRLLDNTLQLNAAAFWDEHKDMQLAVFLGTGSAASIVRNAAGARIRGLELEAIARPVDWLTVNTSFALLDTKYKKFVEVPGGPDVSDNRAFPHAPKYTASAGVDWRVVEGDWGRFNLIGDLNFVSSYYTFPYALRVDNPSDQNARNTRSPGRTIVNLRGTFADLPIGNVNAELSLWVRNLTKEKAPQNFIDFGPSFGGLTVGYFPDPRTYGVTLGMRF